jgi:hypothetical protein
MRDMPMRDMPKLDMSKLDHLPISGKLNQTAGGASWRQGAVCSALSTASPTFSLVRSSQTEAKLTYFSELKLT